MHEPCIIHTTIIILEDEHMPSDLFVMLTYRVAEPFHSYVPKHPLTNPVTDSSSHFHLEYNPYQEPDDKGYPGNTK